VENHPGGDLGLKCQKEGSVIQKKRKITGVTSWKGRKRGGEGTEKKEEKVKGGKGKASVWFAKRGGGQGRLKGKRKCRGKKGKGALAGGGGRRGK